jgi:hypothetical protein
MPASNLQTTPGPQWVQRLDETFPTVETKPEGEQKDQPALDQAFSKAALEVFRLQAKHNPLYLRWLRGLRCQPERLDHWTQIPALPIACFREHLVHTPYGPVAPEGAAPSAVWPSVPPDGVVGLTEKDGMVLEKEAAACVHEPPLLFLSSGSTSTTASRHWIPEPSRYQDAFLRGFRREFGDERHWAFLCLLPAYLERQGSSLVYMCQKLIDASTHAESGFFLDDHAGLLERAFQLKQRGVPTMLFGAAFALLDLAESGPHQLHGLHVVETGGMKGRRKELIRSALHHALCEGLGVDRIGGEYGMTELCSQAWSDGDGLYRCPPWMRIRIRDLNDPLRPLPQGQVGAIDVFDLANAHSCAFIATADLGRSHPDGRFEVLGRYDHAELRGCNLMVV